jgi:hypothetical protein
MDIQEIINGIESEWELETGFLGQLRLGKFDPVGLERLLGILGEIQLNDEQLINRRLVSLLWYIPIFMSWQLERLQNQASEMKQVDHSRNEILILLEKILGIP